MDVAARRVGDVWRVRRLQRCALDDREGTSKSPSPISEMALEAWAGPAGSQPSLQAIVTDRRGGSAPGQPPLLQGMTVAVAVAVAASAGPSVVQRAHHMLSTSLRAALQRRGTYSFCFLLVQVQIWFTGPCAAPPRPNCRRAAGSENTSCESSSRLTTSTTREHCPPPTACGQRAIDSGARTCCKCVSCKLTPACECTAASF